MFHCILRILVVNSHKKSLFQLLKLLKILTPYNYMYYLIANLLGGQSVLA